MGKDIKDIDVVPSCDLLFQMWRAATTELVATACLIFTLTTSIISCLNSHEAEPKLLVPFAVFIIAFLFLMVTVPLSGGHMSPVFTFIAALKGIITLARAAIYVFAQCLGSIISFVIMSSVMSQNAAQKYFYGGCIIEGNGETRGIDAETALILEFTCTFVVLFVGVTVAFDKRRCKELGLGMVCGIVAGSMAIAVFVSITITGEAGYSGVGLNPARCLGPALIHGGSLWEGHWVFWVGPFVACIVYYGYTKTLPREGLLWDTSDYDFISLVRAFISGTAIPPHLQDKSKDINTNM
ncbi:hypothetical protein Pint_34837 [Pistacia integerrima]|uniref:Uncharacterized protein n=1 Tax=Pistacia integerrima TaxID=434235 RepID=A0ACC0X8X5_9ROSI|nr:hypothetical protein Pint_34837 [Pistacia integerrima]